MNIRFHTTTPLVAIACAALLLGGCSSGPKRSEGAIAARDKLTRLQSDPELAGRAQVAMQEAENAVSIAEQPERDRALAAHRVYVADRKVDIAWARADAERLEAQRGALSEERERARLDARTREADRARMAADDARRQAEAARLDSVAARGDADVARSQAEVAMVEREAAKQQADAALAEREAAKQQADAALAEREAARSQADAARGEAAAARDDADIARSEADAAALDRQTAQQQAEAARQQAAELRRQVAELNARETERGLVVTLGDVLFETGKADLKGGAVNNLGKLASFLKEYDDRAVVIEGHTDNVGGDDYNQRLSQQRAESVKQFLQTHGVAATRISASGKGEAMPVADNTSSTGRQQNRRVEVIIANPQTAAN